MHKEESRTELGTIRIHKNVIASIASLAAEEIDGVKKVGLSPKGNILELINKKYFSGIKVEIDKDEEVRIEIPLIVKYGFNIPDTANKTQESVRNALEKMTNLSIKDIDINVQGIEKD
jgi:uncharacterized alkaline shock family protein YloU